VVSGLHVGQESEHTRVAAVTFSDDAHLEFYLNEYMDKDALLDRVSQVSLR
jgi:hypothetical protein